jgi:ribonuclease HI
MELLAVIVGLRALRERCTVTIYCDSLYVVNAIQNGWAARWRENGWKRNKKEKAVNADLWQQLLDMCDTHDVKMIWVRGHSGVKENERCDELSVAAALGPDLAADEQYEKLQAD